MTEVVAALIPEGGRFLICRRPADKSCALLWEFAGGKVEPGETPEQALARECREELGIDIRVGDIFVQVTHDYPDITVHLTLYLAQITRGRPQMLEHSALAWIAPEEIGHYEFCPADRDILEKIRREWPDICPA